MDNRKFRIELGINLFAAPVPMTNPNLRIFPLQNALIDISGGKRAARPAWYSRLNTGDEISFRLVDLSSARVPDHQPEYPEMALVEFLFNDPMTGQPTNPFTERIAEWQISNRRKNRWSPVYSQSRDEKLPTWNLYPCNVEGTKLKKLRFAECDEGESCRAVELTVAIKLPHDGWIDHFVFDPEMIISETDNDGDF